MEGSDPYRHGEVDRVAVGEVLDLGCWMVRVVSLGAGGGEGGGAEEGLEGEEGAGEVIWGG